LLQLCCNRWSTAQINPAIFERGAKNPAKKVRRILASKISPGDKFIAKSPNRRLSAALCNTFQKDSQQKKSTAQIRKSPFSRQTMFWYMQG